jgi:tetratricopeptide (TPR) repeat protein
LKNKLTYRLIFLVLLSVSLTGQLSYSQIFPEVNTPQMQKQKERDEKEKLGMYYYNQKEFDQAASIFKELYEKQPSQFYYTYYLYCLIELREYDDAEKFVRQAIKRESSSPRLEVDLGFIYILSDKQEKADKQFQNVLNSLPARREAIQQVAGAFENRQLYDWAAKTYLKGRELLGKQESFHVDLSMIYQITGDYMAMINEYLDLLEEDPTKLDFVEGRLQDALNKDTDQKISNLLRECLLKRSQKNPDNQYMSEMLLWLSVQRKDFEFALIQAKSLDKRFHGNGEQVFDLAGLALSNNDYDVAIEAYQYILLKGPEIPFYPDARSGYLRTMFFKITNNLAYSKKDLIVLEKEYKEALTELGYNLKSAGLMKDLAHLDAFYLSRLDDAIALLETAIGLPTIPEKAIADCKLELADILLFKGDIWEASLLYSQVEKAFPNEPIGHQAKFKNAKLSYYIGEFEWSKAQLDVLKAATSKLIANDAMELSLLISDNMDMDSSYTGLKIYARADLQEYQNKDSLALITLDTISMLGLSHPLGDEAIYKKAEIFIKDGYYQLADSALALVISKYPDDILADNALYKRAQLQEEVFHNKNLAMQLYEQLMEDYPGSLFVTEARKRFRALRGDNT